MPKIAVVLRRVRAPKVVEVHVSTAVGALRDVNRWPKFSVEIGGEDSTELGVAYAPDGGTVVFRKILAANKDGKRVYNMEQLVKQITLSLQTDQNKETHLFNDYESIEEAFGDDTCLSRHLKWDLGTCKKGKKVNLTERVTIEKNKLIITRVEIYLHFEGDKNRYKIFSSRNEPVTILDNSNFTHAIGFKNNPYWLLHFYSSNCNTWDNPNHDGTEFGEYMWNNYTNNNSDK